MPSAEHIRRITDELNAADIAAGREPRMNPPKDLEKRIKAMHNLPPLDERVPVEDVEEAPSPKKNGKKT